LPLPLPIVVKDEDEMPSEEDDQTTVSETSAFFKKIFRCKKPRSKTETDKTSP
jgi:hypothetical protein